MSALLIEPIVNERLQPGRRLQRIRAVGFDDQFGALRRGERDHVHDALSVNLMGAFTDANITFKLMREIDKHHRRPGMQSQLVENRHVDFYLCRFGLHNPDPRHRAPVGHRGIECRDIANPLPRLPRSLEAA